MGQLCFHKESIFLYPCMHGSKVTGGIEKRDEQIE